MIGTIISILMAILIGVLPFFWEVHAGLSSALNFIFIPSAFFFLALLYYLFTSAWQPLSQAEQTLLPRVSDLFQKDRYFSYIYGWVTFFVLISFALAYEVSFLSVIPESYILAAWLVLLGVSIDLIYYLAKHVASYFNPHSVIKLFSEKAKNCIRNDKENELLEWIDALTELSHRGIDRSNVSLSIAAIDEVPSIAHIFLESSKSIGHIEVNVKEVDNFDNVSYTLFYILQRLEFVNDYAVERGFENICNAMITRVGKIAISASKCDLTLASYPLHSLGKIAKSAQKNDMPEVGVKAILMFTEIAKVILTEIDYTYLEIKDPFLSIISNLEDITKETFLKDKSINIKILMQPFQELKVLFSSDKAAAHQDTPIIMQNIERVIGEYESLQLVMKTMPPIPTIKETAGP